MAINFPTSIDSLTNPLGTDQVAVVDHAEQHSNANDILEALEAKVGVNSSAVITSHDYKLQGVTGSDKASSVTGTETLTNKTLTAPKLANGGYIADANGNELIEGTTTASATNHIGTTNAATGNDPLIEAKGSDTNISLKVKGKGTGKVKLGTAELQFPNVDGSSTQVMVTNGSGVLSWATPSAGAGTVTTMFPKATLGVTSYTNVGRNINTQMFFCLVDVLESMTINSLLFYTGTVTTPGTIKIALFSLDGQTKHFEVTSGTVATSTLNSVTVSPAYVISPGKYYLAFCTVGTTNAEFATQTINGSIYANFNFATGEYYYQGYKTITASTIPTTFDPAASVTADSLTGLFVRFEN